MRNRRGVAVVAVTGNHTVIPSGAGRFFFRVHFL